MVTPQTEQQAKKEIKEFLDSDSDGEGEAYTREKILGEGTFAVVYLGKQKNTGRTVAVKKMKVGGMKDGLDMSAIREIKTLKELTHPNIIELIEVYMYKDTLNLILEYLESDLEKIIKDENLLFMPADIKSWMLMTLKGLEFCHINNILHRDLKPNNLLLASDGQLKLADFGLARDFGEPNQMTSEVVTRWYRAPELFLGARSYSVGIDMWAVGCIFAELMLRVPFLAGPSDMEQLSTIYDALGTPTKEEWEFINKLPNYKVPEDVKQKTPLKSLFTAASDDAIDLLEGFLKYNPNKRITATKAIEHAYFQVQPHPTLPEKLPKITKVAVDNKRSGDDLIGEDPLEYKRVK